MSVWFTVVLLGVLEGITEFIPVSSTGHLLLFETLVQRAGALSPNHWLIEQGARKDLFNVVIQCGAVLAVLPLFPERLRQFVFHWREPAVRQYLLKIVAAFALTGVGGLMLERSNFVLPEQVVPIVMALLVGGILFVAIEWWLSGKPLRDEITWPIVIAVGLAQLAAAVFPGTSRSGSTILVALLFGLNRVSATEFTFLVGIPTMLAAGGLKIFKELHRAGSVPEGYWAMVLLGSLVAAVVSFVAVKWLLRYVQTHTFVVFGWYRIALSIIVALLLMR